MPGATRTRCNLLTPGGLKLQGHAPLRPYVRHATTCIGIEEDEGGVSGMEHDVRCVRRVGERRVEALSSASEEQSFKRNFVFALTRSSSCSLCTRSLWRSSLLEIVWKVGATTTLEARGSMHAVTYARAVARASLSVLLLSFRSTRETLCPRDLVNCESAEASPHFSSRAEQLSFSRVRKLELFATALAASEYIRN